MALLDPLNSPKAKAFLSAIQTVTGQKGLGSQLRMISITMPSLNGVFSDPEKFFELAANIKSEYERILSDNSEVVTTGTR
jgi:hypothetical protein